MTRTKIIVATTHIDRQFTQFSKEALEDAADQVNRGSRPLLTVEHDPTLPPFGKGVKASVELRDDGHHQLVVEHEVFDEVLWTDLPDGTKLFRQESATDKLPFSDRYSELTDDPFISFDPVNFGTQSDSVAFIDANDEPTTAGIMKWTKRAEDEHPLPHACMGDLLRFKREEVDRWAQEEAARRRAEGNRKKLQLAS